MKNLDIRQGRNVIKMVTTEKMDRFPPYKTGGDYLDSKLATSATCKFPKWGETAVLDQLLENDILNENEFQLKEKRREVLERKIDFQAQWHDIELKELSLRESFLHFNKFVRENMEKRERALKKGNEEKILKEKRIVDVINMKQKLADLTESKLNMETVLRSYSIFEGYLQNVIARSEREFKSTDDILNKYESLQATKCKLAIRQETTLTELENSKSRLNKLSEEHTLIAMGLNNQLASLTERFKRVNEHALANETLVCKIKGASVLYYRELYDVKAAVASMYHQICDRKGIERTIPATNSEQLLTFIKKSIKEVKRARKLMIKMLEKPEREVKKISLDVSVF